MHATKIRIFWKMLLAFALWLGLPFAYQATAATRPNIVYILADDMGYADAGFNGGNEIKTPYWKLFDRQIDPSEMRRVFDDPAYADVQTNLMQEVLRLRTQLKEPAHDDLKSFGPPEKYPYN